MSYIIDQEVAMSYIYIGIAVVIAAMGGVIWAKDQRINVLVAEKKQSEAQVQEAMATLAQQQQAVQNLLDKEKQAHVNAEQSLAKSQGVVKDLTKQIEILAKIPATFPNNLCQSAEKLIDLNP